MYLSNGYVDFSKLLHGFVKIDVFLDFFELSCGFVEVVTRNCQSCSMFFSLVAKQTKLKFDHDFKAC